MGVAASYCLDAFLQHGEEIWSDMLRTWVQLKRKEKKEKKRKWVQVKKADLQRKPVHGEMATNTLKVCFLHTCMLWPTWLELCLSYYAQRKQQYVQSLYVQSL